MSSINCINELEDAVLGSICDLLDALSIVELLHVGNRLLTLKLCSPFGISRYCNVGEYGTSEGPHEVILPQLKGLKTVSITGYESRLGSLLEYLPETLTCIEFEGIDCF
ncbi:MAG: hypothetical protein JNL74_22625 [Fibrobacteres bacterium]|nr:hypothetical protein [Fibrobacterota bacterium]